jgi:AraC family transcriptional regulator, alkane utilization regulator
MDALSEVLSSVRLEGALYINGEFGAPWCLHGRCGMANVRRWLPEADHVMLFHFVAEGACQVQVDGDPLVLDVSAGHLVLFPQDDRHRMGSDLHMAPLETALYSFRDSRAEGELNVFRLGGDGPVTRFVCGYLACNRSASRPLIDALPRVVRIPIAESHGAALVHDLLRAGVRESSSASPGARSTLARLAELLLVEALRRYVADLPQDKKGWFAAARDANIGHALSLMHSAPARNWTVEELAREVALSRSALAERFTTLLGEPPMQYLTRWRLALAARSLRASNEAIGRIADQSGYESEAAFTRAFKREFGMPPREWRKSAAA